MDRSHSPVSSLHSDPRAHDSLLAETPSHTKDTAHHNVKEDVAEDGFGTRLASRRPGRSWWIFALVGPYTALAVLTWTVLCIQVDRPLTTASYGALSDQLPSSNLAEVYARNQRLFEAMRVIQAVLAVLTIPITTAVIARAAVVFAQAPSSTLTLRQMVALADCAWSDPSIIKKIFLGHMRRHSSSLLIIAMCLNLLGASVAPLQTYFMTTTTIKTPGLAEGLLHNTADLLYILNQTGTDFNLNLATVSTRSALSSASRTDTQPYLWTKKAASDCNTFGACLDSHSLGNLLPADDPFYALLPYTTNTGLLTQYLPRLASFAERTVIDANEWPKNCQSLPNSFFAQYSFGPALDEGGWSMTACMPASMGKSPWQATRDRQDIVETLYLNISVNAQTYWAPFTLNVSEISKIELNTSLGFFELPNYANNNTAGPLLDVSPLTADDDNEVQDDGTGYRRRDESSGTTNATISTSALEAVPNKGPLLTLALALFGNGSFIASRALHPEAYVTPAQDEDSRTCLDTMPLMTLLVTDPEFQQRGTEYPGCVLSGTSELAEIQGDVAIWLSALTSAPINTIYVSTSDQIASAFTGAAFIANQAWLSQQPQPSNNFFVTADLGLDTLKPHISITGRITVAVLMFIYLVSLWALSIYANSKPRWTSRLGASAMLRLGAALSDVLHLKYASDLESVKIFDEMPGWVGAVPGSDGRAATLRLGSGFALVAKTPLDAYD